MKTRIRLYIFFSQEAALTARVGARTEAPVLLYLSACLRVKQSRNENARYRIARWSSRDLALMDTPHAKKSSDRLCVCSMKFHATLQKRVRQCNHLTCDATSCRKRSASIG